MPYSKLYLDGQWASILQFGVGFLVNFSLISEFPMLFFSLWYKHAFWLNHLKLWKVGLLESLSPLHILAFRDLYLDVGSKKQWSRPFQADPPQQWGAIICRGCKSQHPKTAKIRNGTRVVLNPCIPLQQGKVLLTSSFDFGIFAFHSGKVPQKIARLRARLLWDLCLP